MKKLLFFLFLCFIPISVSGLSMDTSATSAILMDQDSGRILYAKDIHNVRSVASISKIMTGIIACESGKLDETVTIGEEILSAYGSAIYIQVGEKMSLRDLTYGLMLRSGNDAALAIATYVSGDVDQFVEKMNEKARELGMKHTVFHNPHGLDEEKGNFSTAYDMAILTSYAMRNKDYKTIVGTKKHTVKTEHNTYAWTNKNKLLTMYRYTTGGKTGYTEIARRTLVSTATKDNLNLVVVTLNDGNDFSDHQNLFEAGFETYQGYQILKHGVINIPDEKKYKNVEFYIKQDFSAALLESEKDHIRLKITLNDNPSYVENDVVGTVHVIVADKEIHTQDIYIRTLKEEKKRGFLTKIIDWFRSL